MATDDDLLTFADEAEVAPSAPDAPPWRILVADDDEDVHKVTQVALRKFAFQDRPLEFLSAYSGREAIETLRQSDDIAVLLLDVVMEEEDSGLTVAETIRNQLGNKLLRIILRTGQPGQAPERDVILRYDINDYRSKANLTATNLFSAVVAALRSYSDLKTIYGLNEEIITTQREIIHTLGEVAEARSRETGLHVRRVGEYCQRLARGVGLGEEEAELLRMAAPLHDLGKLGVPDEILQKAGKLTDEEFRVMQKHTSIGAQMLATSERRILQTGAMIAAQHHERFDGAGYPRGLAGEAIHIFARITALADVFDALASDRVYRKAWPKEKIRRFFEEDRGGQFDPELVAILLAGFDGFYEYHCANIEAS